jgi:hypothetical protein
MQLRSTYHSHLGTLGDLLRVLNFYHTCPTLTSISHRDIYMLTYKAVQSIYSRIFFCTCTGNCGYKVERERKFCVGLGFELGRLKKHKPFMPVDALLSSFVEIVNAVFHSQQICSLLSVLQLQATFALSLHLFVFFSR